MSFARVFRAAALALAVSAPVALAGCTLTPVYGDPAAARSNLALNYAEPETRLEQVVYQTLSARLNSTDTSAPVFSASVSAGASRLGVSEISSPLTDYLVTATINYTVTQNGTTLASGRRTGTASYQTTGQYVADDAARANAQEQAARAAAETVRLALIAELAAQ